MHQIFVGVGRDLISFLYDSITTDRKSALNKSLQKVCLPKEFKRSVRSLELLKNFKANELKCHLFYILPVGLPPFIGGEEKLSDQEEFRKIVFCLRCMYESSAHDKLFAKIIKTFCVSISEKSQRFESINFHLLPHLQWQIKNVGPLFRTSAAMFESANHLLISPLTGTLNKCQLMTERFLWFKLISMFAKEDDRFSQFFKKFQLLQFLTTVFFTIKLLKFRALSKKTVTQEFFVGLRIIKCIWTPPRTVEIEMQIVLDN